MDYIQIPEIHVTGSKIPVIYLDTCAMIELARFENGSSTNAHKQEIGVLYEILLELMRAKRILCPMGNQLQEMGMTKDREKAKLFLYRFTNSELLHPELIMNAQMKLGYRAFSSKDNAIVCGRSTAFEEDKYSMSPFIVHAAPVYSQEKAETLRQEKYHIVDILNEMKLSKRIQADFNSQLRVELEAEYILFRNGILDKAPSSQEEFTRYVNEIEKFYRTTGCDVSSTLKQFTDECSSYGTFLRSPYHDRLPYIWIRENLWTHLMQRPNKIVQGDDLDVKWAAAYLPYVNYAVTDHSFCTLLKNSGLAELYGTKVFSLRTLDSLLSDLKAIRSNI
jgi:hypothetical protein